MSVLSPEITQQLGQLLQGLQSSDNVVRQQAEDAMESQWVDARLDVFLMGLIEYIQSTQDAGVRKHSILHHGKDHILCQELEP